MPGSNPRSSRASAVAGPMATSSHEASAAASRPQSRRRSQNALTPLALVKITVS